MESVLLARTDEFNVQNLPFSGSTGSYECISSQSGYEPEAFSCRHQSGACRAHHHPRQRPGQGRQSRALRTHHHGRRRLGHAGARQHGQPSWAQRTARSSPRATWTRTILQAAVDTINGHYKNQDCKAYHDYREMMARKDIDAVMLAVPDHLARADRRRGRQEQEGHLRRETAGPHHRRAAGHRQSRAEEQAHLADRLVAAVASDLPQGGRDRPQRADRQGHARRGRPAHRPS